VERLDAGVGAGYRQIPRSRWMWPTERRGVESADGGVESRTGRMLRAALPRLCGGVPSPC
jgi:hypothetical protein